MVLTGEAPEPGGNHEVMRLADGRKVAIPIPHPASEESSASACGA